MKQSRALRAVCCLSWFSCTHPYYRHLWCPRRGPCRCCDPACASLNLPSSVARRCCCPDWRLLPSPCRCCRARPCQLPLREKVAHCRRQKSKKWRDIKWRREWAISLRTRVLLHFIINFSTSMSTFHKLAVHFLFLYIFDCITLKKSIFIRWRWWWK